MAGLAGHLSQEDKEILEREGPDAFKPREELHDDCPDCGTKLVGGDNWSGVKCPRPGCGYWFCY